MNTIQISYTTKLLNISALQVTRTAELIEAGATVPFIARYRKEVTGGLDEVKILEIKNLLDKFNEADKRRLAILNSIEEQGKLTEDLSKQLNEALFIKELEEIYLPYKPKKKTKASIAIEAGLEPLAKEIYEQKSKNLDKLAEKFLNDKTKDTASALSGARDIIAEWISDNLTFRQVVRNIFERKGILTSKVKKGKEKEGEKFQDYFDTEELAKNIPSHRYLAVRRGEEEGFLKVSIDIDPDEAANSIGRLLLQGLPECKEQVEKALEDSLKRLMLPSLEKDFDSTLKEKADKAAIEIFSKNLRQLLLSPPMGQKRIMGIDPGFRTGCKVVVLDPKGDLLGDTVIFPQNKILEAEATVTHLWAKHHIEAVAIGNGTASRETQQFIKDIIRKKQEFKSLQVVMVSEQGASIYSASEIAREEFPNKDITVRGAVSIARRLMDPLAELVKVEPKSIGVGQYQHDVNQKQLQESLDYVVESCVNAVGVEVNTASKHLLSYVAGIGPIIAKNIVEYRSKNGNFKTRQDLKKVARLGDKAFEQAAGFLRIRNSENPLDNTAVHPESYSIVEKMAKNSKANISQFIKSEELQNQVNLKDYLTDKVGLPTLKDILEEIKKPGRDPRELFESVEFAEVSNISDLKLGMVLPGVVTNITAFGCFVDIGVHQDGLVHLSNMANRFIKDPNEVVKVHQKISVKVIEIDEPRKRISLSMKEA